MAGDFRVLNSGLKQTATNAAATIVAAEVTAGFHGEEKAVDDRFTLIAQNLFAELKEVADADNELLASQQAASKASGGGSGSSVESDGSMAIKGGKFPGKTIAEVFAMSASEAGGFGYVDQNGNDKPGSQYIEWMASDSNKNNFSRPRAKAFLETKRAQAA